jgi:hypothetical protein
MPGAQLNGKIEVPEVNNVVNAHHINLSSAARNTGRWNLPATL